VSERDKDKSEPSLADTMASDVEEESATPGPKSSAGRGRTGLFIGIGVVVVAGIAIGVFAMRKGGGKKKSANKPPTTVDAGASAKPDRAALRERAYGKIREALGATAPAIRAQACAAAGKIVDRVSIPTLLGLVEGDPAAEVRGEAANALAALRANGARPVLEKLLAKAEPGLAVWFTDALAQLGDAKARKKLVELAGADDLSISFRACLALANLSPAGDEKVIAVLRKLAAREAELNKIAKYAGAVILTKLAHLRFAQAKKMLYGLLSNPDVGVRVAAAEGLARLGDDAGKQVLKQAMADTASPYRPAAAVALVSLGDYSGAETLSKLLGHKDANVRRLAARGVGEIGDGNMLATLAGMLDDADKSVQLAAAVAIVQIARLDHGSLASASVDWAKTALRSEDWAVRDAAAKTVGDLPEKKAVPLLAQAIADKNPKVRIAAAVGARRLRGTKAARTVAAALDRETNKAVQEQQVKALGKIGQPDGTQILEKLAGKSDRVGIMALGALIALGKLELANKLAAFLDNRSAAIRLAALDAAMLAGHAVVVPMLVRGLGDRDPRVRLSAAVALARHNANKDEALPILQKALASTDPLVSGRARAALIRFGVIPENPNVAELLDSPDARVRRAAIDALAAMSWESARPLLRRAIYDPDPATRWAAVDAIAVHTSADKEELITMYKLVIKHPDPVCRARGQAQLAKLLDDSSPAPAAPTNKTVDPAVVKRAAGLVRAAHEELEAAKRKLEAEDSKITAIIGRAPQNDQELDEVEKLVKRLERTLVPVRKARTKVESAAKTFNALAVGAPPAELASTITETRALIEQSKSLARKAIQRVRSTASRAKKYVRDQTANPAMLVASADTAISVGQLSSARRDLRKAQKAYARLKTSNPRIHFLFGRLYEAMARGAKTPKARKRSLRYAKRSYDRFTRSGKGFEVGQARKRSAAIAKELAKLK
jgi:HEAT repeat protein